MARTARGTALAALQEYVSTVQTHSFGSVDDMADQLYNLTLAAGLQGYSLDELAMLALERNAR